MFDNEIRKVIELYDQIMEILLMADEPAELLPEIEKNWEMAKKAAEHAHQIRVKYAIMQTKKLKNSKK